MKFDFRYLVATAAIALMPTFASAVTLSVDDLGTIGVDSVTVGGSSASATGTVGGFEVAIASGSISSTLNSYTLNTSSIQVAGVGTLQVTLEQTGLTGFSLPNLNLVGTGSVSDHGTTITVAHMIDFGGGYQTIGNILSFTGGTPGPFNLSDITSDTVLGSPTFDLKSVLTITNSSNDQTANVNSTLVATAQQAATPVPVPAGGLLLLSGLAGFAGLRRRKKRAAKP